MNKEAKLVVAIKEAIDLIHEDIIQNDKAGRRLNAEAILVNALCETGNWPLAPAS